MRNSDALLQHEQHPSQQPQATILSCVINLTNTIIGAGMLGLPGAFAGTGYVGGTILILCGAFFSTNGLYLLSSAAQRAGLPSSFYSVAAAAVPQYTILIDLAVALKCFGVATGYLITISDCMVDALDHILLNDQESTGLTAIILTRQFWVIGAVLAVLPLSFYKTLDDLKKTSALALVFVLFLAFGIVAYANGLADPCLDYANDDECRGEVVAFTDIPTTVSKLPIFVFAFTCHQNIFPVVNELQARTQSRLNTVIASSIGIALVVFYIVAMEGYFTFGSLTRGDVILNYPETFNVTLLRICIAVMLTLHYPLQLDPSRRCIQSLLTVVRQWWNSSSNVSSTSTEQVSQHGRDDSDHHISTTEAQSTFQEMDDDKQASATTITDNDDTRQFYAITIAFLGASFVVAMVVEDLGVVLAMVGATGSTLVSYVLPGLIYVKLHPYQDLSKALAMLQLGVGCIIIPLALYFVIKERM